MKMPTATSIAASALLFLGIAGYSHAQPVILKRTFQSPTPAANDIFGSSVAAVGNNVLVGAPLNDNGVTDAGAAYLFDGNTGALLLTFANPSPDEGDQFGFSVAAVGNSVLISAPFDDAGATDAGVVYQFDGVSGNLVHTFQNPSPDASDQFGLTVAGAGNNAIIGAPFDDAVAAENGVVYLFDGSTGALLQTFMNPSPAVGDQFGGAIAGVGNNVLIGSPFDDTGAFLDAGAAYLFDGATGGLLLPLNNPSPAVSDQFGNSVSCVGNDLLIAARLDDAGATNSGAVYLFNGISGVLLFTMTNPTPASGDEFGNAVSGVGNNVLMLVGGGRDDTGATNSGSAYVFDGSSGTLLHTLANPTPAFGDQFGITVASMGDKFLVGSPFDDTAATNSGAVYLFGPPNQPPLANAGADQTAECMSPAGTNIILDGSGSSDPDLDVLTYTWREGVTVIAGPTNSATSAVTLALGNHSIELTVDDGKGETDSDLVEVSIVDTTPPVITVNGGNPLILECHIDSYTEPGVTVSDAADPSPTVNIVGAVDANVVGVYTITYSVSDANGNNASATRTVNVVDTTPPMMTLNGENPMTIECQTGTYTEPGATVSDACDPAPVLAIAGAVDVHVVGTYILTYTVTDASGNTVSATRTVNVECPLPHPYVLLAQKKITIDHENHSEGNIHSNWDIEFRDGNPSTHTGNLTAVDDISIAKQNTINGNVTAGDNVSISGSATVNGTVTSHVDVDPYPLPSFYFNAGYKNVAVYQYQSRNLEPGAYYYVTVGYRANLSLYNNGTTGEYFIYQLDLDNYATLSVDVSSGPVVINLVRKFHFDKDTKVIITPDVPSSSRIVTFNIRGGDDQHIHERASVSGNINAPYANVMLKPNSFFRGAIAAEYITVGYNATVLHHTSTTMSAKITTATAGDAQQAAEAEESEAEESLMSEENPAVVVTSYALEQNYPNPFNPATDITFAMPEAGRVMVKIFNTLGEEVRTLVDGDYAMGVHVAHWDGRNYRGEQVPSGVYFYQMSTAKFKETKKMLMAK